jgi:hypothetical protein
MIETLLISLFFLSFVLSFLATSKIVDSETLPIHKKMLLTILSWTIPYAGACYSIGIASASKIKEPLPLRSDLPS